MFILQTVLKNYPPIALNDLVVSDQGIKEFLEDYTKGYVVNNLLLVGNNGTGKSTIAKLLPTLVEGHNPHFDELQGTEGFDVNGAVTKLENIKHFAGLLDQKYHYIIFNELDKVKTNLAAFWQLMDAWGDRVVMIATANDYNKIDPCMRSRFKVVNLPPIKAKDFLPRAMEIFGKEKVNLKSDYMLEQLKLIEDFGDIRKYVDLLKDIYRKHRMDRIDQEHYNA
ncbi:AAA family ATPase [Candidatus Methylopumilus planktonicus]|jgi:DNA polymerase III delta prime subunit|uniref:AAA family ATPase n=1 Tax=Candidatus Methylopumilus planktonicus TaxID=1581557 RepID=UPI003D1879F4